MIAFIDGIIDWVGSAIESAKDFFVWLLDTLHALFIVPLHEVAYQKALIGGSLVAIVCGVVGCFIILRRMAFLGDALSHSMLAGVVAGYLLMQVLVGEEAHAPAMIVGSILAGLVTVGMIGFISNVSRIKDDTAIGIMYTGIFAVGGVVTSIFQDRIHIHVYDYIVGMLLAISDGHLWMMAIIAAFVLSRSSSSSSDICRSQRFDPVMAASLGISVVGVNYLLTTCTSLVVVGAVSVVGIILVVGLLVTPAATAYLLCDRLSRMLVLSATFGVSSVVGGLYSTIWLGQLGLDVATGAAIVVISTIQFLFVLMVGTSIRSHRRSVAVVAGRAAVAGRGRFRSHSPRAAAARSDRRDRAIDRGARASGEASDSFAAASGIDRERGQRNQIHASGPPRSPPPDASSPTVGSLPGARGDAGRSTSCHSASARTRTRRRDGGLPRRQTWPSAARPSRFGYSRRLCSSCPRHGGESQFAA